MTCIAESTVRRSRAAGIAARTRALFARLRQRRRRRLARIALESWSRHLLRDIGLSE